MASVFGLCERCQQLGKILHHKKKLTPQNIDDPDIALNWDNLEFLCLDCHNKEHFGSIEIAFDDEGDMIRDSLGQIICGARGSGKTTFVQQMKKRGDLVLDLDYINAALLGEQGLYHNHSTVLPVALEVREAVYRCIVERKGTWGKAYVITTISDMYELKSLALRLGLEIHIMQTSEDECLDRIQKDTRRIGREKLFEKLVRDWFEKYKKTKEILNDDEFLYPPGA